MDTSIYWPVTHGSSNKRNDDASKVINVIRQQGEVLLQVVRSRIGGVTSGNPMRLGI